MNPEDLLFSSKVLTVTPGEPDAEGGTCNGDDGGVIGRPPARGEELGTEEEYTGGGAIGISTFSLGTDLNLEDGEVVTEVLDSVRGLADMLPCIDLLLEVAARLSVVNRGTLSPPFSVGIFSGYKLSSTSRVIPGWYE